MININFTNIDNSKLVGRLLPFWARGRKTSLLLQALLSPLIMVHNKFKAWALELYIMSHITAQQASLEWYLNYRLKKHFKNPSSTFLIVHGINELMSCYSSGYWRNGLHWDNDGKWGVNKDALTYLNMNLSCTNTGLWRNNMYWSNALLYEDEPNGIELDDDFIEAMDHVNVYAPAIVDTIAYDSEDYKRDIRNIMSKFMINFNPIRIFITNH